MFVWPELNEIAREPPEEACNSLLDRLVNYAILSGQQVVVFGGQLGKNSYEGKDYFGLSLVFTGEKQTADDFIVTVFISLGYRCPGG
ncbi:NYN domain-containing protein [Syntrophomonas erecta]